jgi:hypothetical protein
VGEQATYLSFDVDALDPAFAPGTGTPQVGGLATWQAQAILRRLENIDFIGMDVVEVAPVYDTAEITALAAATIVWEYLALIALHNDRQCGGMAKTVSVDSRDSRHHSRRQRNLRAGRLHIRQCERSRLQGSKGAVISMAQHQQNQHFASSQDDANRRAIRDCR